MSSSRHPVRLASLPCIQDSERQVSVVSVPTQGVEALPYGVDADGRSGTEGRIKDSADATICKKDELALVLFIIRPRSGRKLFTAL